MYTLVAPMVRTDLFLGQSRVPEKNSGAKFEAQDVFFID